MTKGTLFGNISVKLFFAILFTIFAVDIVSTDGWTFFAVICILFAALDIVQSIQLFDIYRQAKNKFINKQ